MQLFILRRYSYASKFTCWSFQTPSSWLCSWLFYQKWQWLASNNGLLVFHERSGREDQGLCAAQRDVKISNQYSFIPPYLQIEERRGCVSPSLLFQGVNVESNRFKSFHWYAKQKASWLTLFDQHELHISSISDIHFLHCISWKGWKMQGPEVSWVLCAFTFIFNSCSQNYSVKDLNYSQNLPIM